MRSIVLSFCSVVPMRPHCFTLFLFFFIFPPIYAAQQEGFDLTVSGVVRDEQSRRPVAFANVFLPGSNIGTVTNGNGVFSLKINSSSVEQGLEFSCMGYAGCRISLKDYKPERGITVWLKPMSQLLNEVRVYGGDAKAIVMEAIEKIPENYSLSANILNMFYRETVTKGNRYVAVSEGLLDVYKNSYNRRHVRGDRVRVTRGRRVLSQKSRDTLAVKIQGGPRLAVDFDVVKNEDLLFDSSSIDYFVFTLDHYMMLDDRLQYVISFTPCAVLEYPLYSGTIYIDTQTMGITLAEFSLDLSDRQKADNAVLRKKPAGLDFRCLEASFTVSYRIRGALFCLDYVKSTLRFKCEWKRRLFSSAYTASSEMVVVDMETEAPSTIPVSDSFGQRDLFEKSAPCNWDSDFWSDYNIIEPSASLEKAAAKLSRLRP